MSRSGTLTRISSTEMSCITSTGCFSWTFWKLSTSRAETMPSKLAKSWLSSSAFSEIRTSASAMRARERASSSSRRDTALVRAASS